MLVGLALGPSVFKIVGPDTLNTLKPLGAFCLALIFFLLGEEFKLDELKQLGPRFLAMTVIQSVVTFGIVTGVLLLFHAPLPIALLLGAIAGTTDPAATIGVIRELKGKGELVKTLMAIVALNGFVEMCIFNALMPIVEITHKGSADVNFLMALREPMVEFGGSLVLGLVLGLALKLWGRTAYGKLHIKLPTLGLILIGSGLCEALHLSILLVMLTFGATVVNAACSKVEIFDIAKGMEGPLLLFFFTISGAGLHLNELATVGWLGVAYVAARFMGKMLGGSLGAVVAGASPVCQKYLGFGLIPQASMAIGLAYVVQAKFPDLAGPILPITLGAIVFFEAVGPWLTRQAIIRSNEAKALVPQAYTNQAA
jgi:Kef-type K+ transport system membrane component KefB